MRTLSAFVVCFLLLIGGLQADQLTPEQDQELYNQILGLMGQTSSTESISTGEEEIVKCGTPYILDIRSRLAGASEKTQALWISLLAERYNSEAPDTIGSPDGHFLIHYATSGVHRVLINDEFGIDPVTNIPEYVLATANIMDSVYDFEINTLGYKVPPVDGYYPSGLDDRYDVYILDLGEIDQGNAYGVTFADDFFGDNMRYATSFLALENDYYELINYRNRPIDAVKVTAAHEFFHAIQFGYDATEYDTVGIYTRRNWMEMSAVWMEDQVYDDVNDYLYYLPSFLGYIEYSIISETPNLFQYGAVPWPMYLSQKWGDSIVKKIWQLCEDVPGPNVFQGAVQDAIEEYSHDDYNFAQALSEFHIWLYFTGTRARPNFGFEEAATWSMIPDKVISGVDTSDYILSYDEYPVEFNDAGYNYYPDHLGAKYVHFSGFNKLDSALHVTFDGIVKKSGYDITWFNRIAGYNPHLPEGAVYIDPAFYDNNYTATLSEDFMTDYTDIVMVLTPYAEIPINTYRLTRLTFTLNVADTSEPIEAIAISDAFPNPYIASKPENDGVFVEVLQPEPQTIKMQIHTLAGERVYAEEFPTSTETTLIRWDGMNESGEQVASGMYLMYISVGDENKVCKIAIIE